MQFEIIHGELVRCTGKQKNGEEIIPSGISIIGTNAIYWYRNIRNIELPEEIKAIGAFAFQGCFELNITFPTSETI